MGQVFQDLVTSLLDKTKLAEIIPVMYKAAGIQGCKTGHSGKMMCATVLRQLNFSDQLIKERTGHHSLESLHKYKWTWSDQQFKVSMALLPPVAKRGKENDSEDDFEPLKKHPKLKDVEGSFLNLASHIVHSI